jgi:hypothetical protein
MIASPTGGQFFSTEIPEKYKKIKTKRTKANLFEKELPKILQNSLLNEENSSVLMLIKITTPHEIAATNNGTKDATSIDPAKYDKVIWVQRPTDR